MNFVNNIMYVSEIITELHIISICVLCKVPAAIVQLRSNSQYRVNRTSDLNDCDE